MLTREEVEAKIPQPDVALYTYTKDNAPDDAVINVTPRPVIIVAEATPIGRDKQRIDQGDRRRGAYYVEQIRLNVGLQLIRDVAQEELEKLEIIRQKRTGERPPDWVLESHAKLGTTQVSTAVKTPTRTCC